MGCLEGNTLHGVWAISRRRERASKYGVISFYGLGNFIGLWVGGLLQLFRGGGWDFQELGHHPLFGLLWSASELAWCWWAYRLAFWCVAVSVRWGSGSGRSWLFHSLSWTSLVPASLCHILWPCYYFKDCAVPPFLLFHTGTMKLCPLHFGLFNLQGSLTCV